MNVKVLSAGQPTASIITHIQTSSTGHIVVSQLYQFAYAKLILAKKEHEITKYNELQKFPVAGKASFYRLIAI